MCHLSLIIQITMLNPSQQIGVEHRKPALARILMIVMLNVFATHYALRRRSEFFAKVSQSLISILRFMQQIHKSFMIL